MDTGDVGLPAGGGVGLEVSESEMVRSFLSVPLRLQGASHGLDRVGGGVGGDGNDGSWMHLGLEADIVRMGSGGLSYGGEWRIGWVGCGDETGGVEGRGVVSGTGGGGGGPAKRKLGRGGLGEGIGL